MYEHIKKDDKKVNNLDLFIKDAEWDAWLAGKDVWEKWLEENQEPVKKSEKKN